jgi:hypothetical protein
LFFYYTNYFWNEEQEGRMGPAGGGGVGTSGMGEDVGIGYRSMNMVLILCTHICKWKNETCLKLFWEWGRGENDGGSEFNHDTL